MKKLEYIVKERLEGYESTLPEGSFAQFQKLRTEGKQAPRKKVYPFVWAAAAAVAASLAAVLFLRQLAQPVEEGVQLVQQQPVQVQLPVADSLTVEEPVVAAPLMAQAVTVKPVKSAARPVVVQPEPLAEPEENAQETPATELPAEPEEFTPETSVPEPEEERETPVTVREEPFLPTDSTIMATRDILLARFRTKDGCDIAFLVNHHPSKYGGLEVSEPRRRIAVQRLRFLADSLQALEIWDTVAMGDFNDTPSNPVYKTLEPTLKNMAEPLHQRGLGTIKYDGAWELIDLFFVSPSLKTAEMKILQIPFLMTPDSGHAGIKPLRTYSGPRYLGGVSDHCPVWLTIYRP